MSERLNPICWVLGMKHIAFRCKMAFWSTYIDSHFFQMSKLNLLSIGRFNISN